MQILATYQHNMGGVFKLAKVSDDFFMYGTQKEFDSLWGVSVDRCGTRDDVLSHCLRIANICSENIEKYKKDKSSFKYIEEIEKKRNLTLKERAKELFEEI